MQGLRWGLLTEAPTHTDINNIFVYSVDQSFRQMCKPSTLIFYVQGHSGSFFVATLEGPRRKKSTAKVTPLPTMKPISVTARMLRILTEPEEASANKAGLRAGIGFCAKGFILLKNAPM